MAFMVYSSVLVVVHVSDDDRQTGDDLTGTGGIMSRLELPGDDRKIRRAFLGVGREGHAIDTHFADGFVLPLTVNHDLDGLPQGTFSTNGADGETVNDLAFKLHGDGIFHDVPSLWFVVFVLFRPAHAAGQAYM
jgi:hypothetical protein